MTAIAIVAIVAIALVIAVFEVMDAKADAKRKAARAAKRPVEKHTSSEVAQVIEDMVILTDSVSSVRVYGGVRSNANTVHTVLVNIETGEERNFFHYSNTPIKVVKSEILATLNNWNK